MAFMHRVDGADSEGSTYPLRDETLSSGLLAALRGLWMVGGKEEASVFRSAILLESS